MRYLPFLILAVGLLMRAPEIHRPFWSDEGITLKTLHVSVTENPLYKGVTTNLPLYFWIISFINWIINPHDQKLLRIFGVMLNLSQGYLLFRFLKDRAGTLTAYLFLCLFTLAPLQIHYSAELRPYVLVQFLIGLLLIEYLDRKRPWVIALIASAGMLTHYSFYIFWTLHTVYLVHSFGITKSLAKCLILPWLVCLVIGALFLANPYFSSSLDDMQLKRESVSPVVRLFNTQNITRTKEVLTNYYYYGLHYYRVDALVQVIFKKLSLVVLLASVIGLFFAKNPQVKRLGLYSLAILGFSLAASLVGEKMGYYPFGGRHIMCFSFLLYVVVAAGLGSICVTKRWVKVIVMFTMIGMLSLFTAFQTCSQIFARRYTGNGDPQGDIYGYCAGHLIQ